MSGRGDNESLPLNSSNKPFHRCFNARLSFEIHCYVCGVSIHDEPILVPGEIHGTNSQASISSVLCQPSSAQWETLPQKLGVSQLSVLAQEAEVLANTKL